ncbi:hypothetical protein C5C56_11375 [Rathayibacter sp. AY1D1]|uniref:T3SS effector HopA1 family protein n=1 Tax=Rathayibacter sp. AY1D1 TaxID=2080542 RepID=UPI000CE93942|nr:T3SS effector HopA1 family protein [Rathayibacter sp. AY1D1]PPH98202.1 hypothetical protein C5C56_11375 [Rathayibacter sp. AY1D1]
MTALTTRSVLDEAVISVDAARLRAEVDGTVIEATGPIELRARLAATVYTHLHLRNPLLGETAGGDGQDLAPRLIDAIPHRTVLQPAPSGVLGSATVQREERRVVELGRVRVLVPEVDLVRSADGAVAGVRLPSWRTRTTPGYLLALGPMGLDPADRVVRLSLVADSAEDALALWGPLLEALAASGARHQAKALSDPRAFPRSDALVVYLPADSADDVARRVTPLLDARPSPRTAVSAFAERLADGLAYAEDPADERSSYRGLSFGQHRSRVLAEALLRSSAETIPAADAWADAARAARIDPDRPGLTAR